MAITLVSTLFVATPLFAFTASDITADADNTATISLGDVDGDN